MDASHLNDISGLQFMPIKSTKAPIFRNWQNTETKYDLSNVEAVGLVCGRFSGNLEVIDFDLKYDLTGTLMKRYKELVAEYSPTLLDRLVWQETPTKGFHALYRCSEIAGNKKLAQRPATDDEMKKGDKVKVLIETRGEGGQIAVHPTPHYRLIKGTWNNIPTITPSEREILHLCASNFNEYFVQTTNYVVSKMSKEGKSPLDDYDERGDCVALLCRHGWTVVSEKGNKILMKRPGETTAIHSGNFDKSRNWFSVFSTSTQFNAQSAYKPSAVYTVLECGGDYHEAAKKLAAEGYGEKKEYKTVKKEVKSTIPVGDKTLSYVASEEQMDGDIKMWREGTFPMGLSWGIPELDKYHLLKRSQFNIMNGHDNVGKSTLMWYLSTVAALLHNWNWVILSVENKPSTVMKRIIEFYWGEDIRDMNEMKFREAKAFFKKHFKIINCIQSFTYVDVLNMVSNIKAQWHVDGLLIDPYNALIREGNVNPHDYDYEAASVMQTYTKANDITMYLNCHSISFANRQKDNFGNPSAPMKADTEGGSKWGNKADDFLTGHRLVYDADKYREMQIYVRKVKETETGGKNTPLSEPVILTMYGHYGFRSVSGVDPIANWRNRNKQVEIKTEEKPPAIRPNINFVSSQDVKEASESPYENDPLTA